MKSIIRLEHLGKRFGQKVIFRDLSLDLPSGQLIGITGESGTGKSTLLNLVSGIEAADSGKVNSCGFSLDKISPRQKTQFYRSSIAFLFQNFGLVEYETVRDNLEMALHYKRMTAKQKEQAMQHALQSVGLPGFLDRKVFELSGGEQQRVALARVALKPSVLILCDEPTGSLDEYNKNVVMQILLSFQKNGKSILLVTHDRSLLPLCQLRYHIQDQGLIQY